MATATIEAVKTAGSGISEGNAIPDAENSPSSAVEYSIILDTAIAFGEEVVLSVTTSDKSEAVLLPLDGLYAVPEGSFESDAAKGDTKQTLIFNEDNWDVEQKITIVGVDDLENDGNQDVTINLKIDTNKTTSLEYLGNDLNGIEIDPINLVNNETFIDIGDGDTLSHDAGFFNVFGSEFNNYKTYTSGIDRIVGENGPDVLSGGDNSDKIFGGFGNDQLSGDKHNDWLYGEQGDDELFGGEHTDRLFGGAGDDWLDGEGGDDYMEGGVGNDTYVVDRAEDVINDNGSASDVDVAHVLITAGQFKLGSSLENAEIKTDNDVGLTGNAKANILIGGAGDNKIVSKGGADEIETGEGEDIIKSGGGNDVVDAGDDDDLVISGAGSDEVDAGKGDDTVKSGGGNDDINAGAGNDVVKSGSGNDEVSAGKGNDKLVGGGGSDILNGGDGNDIIIGGNGNNVAIGGEGDDIFQFANTKGTQEIEDFETGEDTIKLKAKIFDALAGDVIDEMLAIGSAAQDSNDFLVYSDGVLYYDADANGSGEAVELVDLAGADISASDFLMY